MGIKTEEKDTAFVTGVYFYDLLIDGTIEESWSETTANNDLFWL
jgi:hypothetical protein